MPSVCGIVMLRSEVEWFPLFIHLCKNRLHYIMNPNETDYEPMRQVTECDSYRQVRSILNAYNGEGFESLVHTQQVLVKKKIEREKRDEFWQ